MPSFVAVLIIYYLAVISRPKIDGGKKTHATQNFAVLSITHRRSARACKAHTHTENRKSPEALSNVAAMVVFGRLTEAEE